MMAPGQIFLVMISTSTFCVVDAYKSCNESASYNSCSKTMCVIDGTDLIVWSYFDCLRCTFPCLLINIVHGPNSPSLTLHTNI